MVADDGPPVVLLSIWLILAVIGFFAIVVTRANRKWDREEGVS